MRLDLLKQWLKMFPYGYCDGINFQTCRSCQNDCPYCMANVHCSEVDVANNFYTELLHYRRMRPHKAYRFTMLFAKNLTAIENAVKDDIIKKYEQEKKERRC